MGNTPPTNRTGKKETKAKLEKAQKLGILSLSEHGLESLPAAVFTLTQLRTLDLSDNKLISLGRLHLLQECKSLNLDGNKLLTGSLGPLSSLSKLQTLSIKRNRLGDTVTSEFGTVPAAPFPAMPASLKQLYLSDNPLGAVPESIYLTTTPTNNHPPLLKLELLDLCRTGIRVIPPELAVLTALQELRLDGNQIDLLPAAMGRFQKLKVLSLRDNRFTVTSTLFNPRTNPQPLPAALFTDTPLIDLNLHGNRMTNTQLNQFEGFDQFLRRRQKVKSKTLTNLDVCGLE